MQVRRRTSRLSNAEPTWVALVKRGANRTPFAIMKSEDGAMGVNLAGLFKKGDGPRVTSVALKNAEQGDAAKAALAEMGYVGELEVFKSEDGGHALIQLSKTSLPVTYFEVADGIAIGVSDVDAEVQKALRQYADSNSDFSAVLKQQGAIPSMRVAMEALHTTIMNAAGSAETPEEFKTKISKAAKEFSSYLENVAGALPQEAFKFEELAARLADAMGAASDAAEVEKTEGGSGTQSGGSKKDSVAKAAENPADDAAAAADGGAAQVEDGTADEEAKTVVKEEAEASETTSGSEDASGMQDALTQIVAKALGPISAQLSALDSRIVSISSEVDNVRQLAKKADEALHGFVPSESRGDAVQKSDVDELEHPGWGDLTDTARNRIDD